MPQGPRAPGRAERQAQAMTYDFSSKASSLVPLWLLFLYRARSCGAAAIARRLSRRQALSSLSRVVPDYQCGHGAFKLVKASRRHFTTMKHADRDVAVQPWRFFAMVSISPNSHRRNPEVGLLPKALP